MIGRGSALAAALMSLATPGFAGPPSVADPTFHAIAKDVSAAELRDDIATLVSFGTRHSLSDRSSSTRGIGAAERWTAREFQSISAVCDGCLQVGVQCEIFTNKRIPEPTSIGAIIAVQRGTTDPNRVIILSGHIDSRAADVMDATADAPGANDDGSGTAAVIEAARALSKHRFAATIVYAVLEGEEQAIGGVLLAHYARRQGWQVEANLSNDIVGNTIGQNGRKVDAYVRVFSEGTKSVETPAQAVKRRFSGGELDSPSRNLARYISEVADRYADDLDNLGVMMVYRTDRFNRGGDHMDMLAAGYPAVRFTEANENYDRQHQYVRTVDGRQFGDVLDGVDFPYLARVTRLNALTAASLAAAPAPPEGIIAARDKAKTGTKLVWSPAPGAVRYRVWWRSSIDPQWSHMRETTETAIDLDDVIIDDWFFGVSSVAADGHESPAAFSGPAGSFVSPVSASQ